MKTLTTWAAALALSALTGAAQATLVNQGDGTVLDTSTNLLWLQNWSAHGQQSWATQKAWADNLSFAGSTAWALPAISDYAALFAEIGDLTSAALPFSNVQLDRYWSGDEYQSGTYAWYTLSNIGGQGSMDENRLASAVAVRRADASATVPEPQTLALALLALAGALLSRRRRAR